MPEVSEGDGDSDTEEVMRRHQNKRHYFTSHARPKSYHGIHSMIN